MPIEVLLVLNKSVDSERLDDESLCVSSVTKPEFQVIEGLFLIQFQFHLNLLVH